MSRPVLSLIIPAYNCEKFIERALRSVINQSYNAYEIIIIDDFSHDNTKQIITDFKAKCKKISLYTLDQNYGVSYCRNYGIRLAKGEYITFLDPDDWLDEETYCKSLKFIKQGVDVITFGIEYNYFDNRESLKKYEYENDYVLDGKQALRLYGCESCKISPIVNNKIYKRSFLLANNIKFDENVRYQEDDAFTFKVLMFAKEIAFISNAFYHYYQHPDSLIHQISALSMNHFVDSYHNLYIYLKEHQKFTIYKDEFYMKFKRSLKGVIQRTIEFGNKNNTEQLLIILFKRIIKDFDIFEILLYFD